MFSEWIKISTPEWRGKLEESIKAGDSFKEKFARYMLKDILNDPEYKDIEIVKI